jgi:hypothetical protein
MQKHRSKQQEAANSWAEKLLRGRLRYLQPPTLSACEKVTSTSKGAKFGKTGEEKAR